jgi:hypothetical protein
MAIVNGKWVFTNTSANTSTNTVDTSTNNMTSIKSIELVQNISLAEKSLTASFIDTCMSKSKGRTICSTRGIGRICENSRDYSLFGFFIPLPEVEELDNGRNNRVVVIFHFEDGTSKILNKIETVKFWDRVLGRSALDTRFQVKFDLPSEYTTAIVVDGLKSHRFQSIRINIEVSDLNRLFEGGKSEHLGDKTRVLRPLGTVSLHSQLVETGANYFGFTFDNDFFVNQNAVKPNSDDCAKESKSSKRREERKAQSKAARQSIAGAVAATSTRKTVAQVQAEREAVVETIAAPVAEIPVTTIIDTEKEALRKENAELKAQVAELSANVASLTAMMQQFMASQAQPVAPTPTVEEVTPEPAAEIVEEAPVVEETIKEEPKATLKSEADFFSGLAKTKARKTASSANVTEEPPVLFNIYDEE